MYKHYIKRFFDIVLSLTFIIMLSPMLALFSILIKIDSKGPILFLQMRIGKDFKPFKIYKFRTMIHRKREPNSEIYKGNAEVTYIGNFLRRFKIDELPQILNVFLGDISLVGPRPILMSAIEDMDEFSKRRMIVLPGVTGLAQINGNIYIDRKERFRYDIEYVNNISFSLDLKILLKTILVVVLGEDKFVKNKMKSNV